MKRIIKADTDILRLKERIAEDKANPDFMKDLPTYGWSQMEDDWQVVEILEWEARDILRSKYNIDVYSFGSAYVYVFDSDDEVLQEEDQEENNEPIPIIERDAPATSNWIKIPLDDYEELELQLINSSNSNEDYLNKYIAKIVELYKNSTFGSIVNIKGATKQIKATLSYKNNFKNNINAVIDILADIAINLDNLQKSNTTCQNNSKLMNELAKATLYVNNCINICVNRYDLVKE